MFDDPAVDDPVDVDAGEDAGLAAHLNAIRRDDISEQSDILGADHFVDKATDDLLLSSA